MKNSFLTAEKLTKDCSVGYAILGYASTHNEGKLRWDLDMVNIDLENENLYHATFSIPQRAGSLLQFTYEVLPKESPEYRCVLISKSLGTLG